MDPEKIIFIRRDNIGDLVCTTPAIRAVRERFPRAQIGILVNTYNAEIVAGHPDLDRIYVFEKPKHAPGRSRWAVYVGKFPALPPDPPGALRRGHRLRQL